MARYYVVPFHARERSVFYVVDAATGETRRTFEDRGEAKRYVRRMNRRDR